MRRFFKAARTLGLGRKIDDYPAPPLPRRLDPDGDGAEKIAGINPLRPFHEHYGLPPAYLLQTVFRRVCPQGQAVKIRVNHRRFRGVMYAVYKCRAADGSPLAARKSVNDPPRQNTFPRAEVSVEEHSVAGAKTPGQLTTKRFRLLGGFRLARDATGSQRSPSPASSSTLFRALGRLGSKSVAASPTAPTSSVKRSPARPCR